MSGGVEVVVVAGAARHLVHLADLLLHLHDLDLARLDLLLELLDLVVEDELELLELLVLLLEVVDPLLLVADRLVALADLLLEPGDVLLQGGDVLVQRLLVVEELADLLLLVLDVLLQSRKLLAHDAVLAFEAERRLALRGQFGLVLLLQVLDLAVDVLLELLPRLLELLDQPLLLAALALEHRRLLLQLVLVAVGELLDARLVLLVLHPEGGRGVSRGVVVVMVVVVVVVVRVMW